MLQIILTLSLLAALIAVVFAMAPKTKYSGDYLCRVMDEFNWYLDRSPAQVAFFMFSLASAIAASIIASALFQVTNQMILTLDILFLLNSLLLILFHQFKEHSCASL